MCDQHIEGFAAQSREPYERLHQRHADAVARFEASQATSNPPTSQSSPQGEQLEQLRSTCDGALDFMIGDGQPPDPRLATTKQTWTTFLGALRSGDKETLAACFNPTDRSKYMTALSQLSRAQLADIASSFSSFELTNLSMKGYEEAAVTKSDGTAGLVLFVESPRGWRISQM